MVGVLLSIPHETEQSSQQRTIWSQKSTVLLWSNSSPDQLEWIRSGTRRTYSCVCSYSNSMYIKSIIYNMYLCFEVASAHWTDFPVPEMVWAWGWQREGLQVTEMNYNELFKKKKIRIRRNLIPQTACTVEAYVVLSYVDKWEQERFLDRRSSWNSLTSVSRLGETWVETLRVGLKSKLSNNIAIKMSKGLWICSSGQILDRVGHAVHVLEQREHYLGKDESRDGWEMICTCLSILSFLITYEDSAAVSVRHRFRIPLPSAGIVSAAEWALTYL